MNCVGQVWASATISSLLELRHSPFFTFGPVINTTLEALNLPRNIFVTLTHVSTLLTYISGGFSRYTSLNYYNQSTLLYHKFGVGIWIGNPRFVPIRILYITTKTFGISIFSTNILGYSERVSILIRKSKAKFVKDKIFIKKEEVILLIIHVFMFF